MIHIFFASRLVLEKGVDILIRTIEETLSHPVLSSSVMWHIASDGEYRDSIIELSRKYPESVFYSGNLSPEAMSEHYRAADLLYMPSRFLETFGLTALESLACGTPVIGMRKGGLIDFIPPDLALDPRSPEKSMISLLEAYISGTPFPTISVNTYCQSDWRIRLSEMLQHEQRICLIHDYTQLIGGAEFYINTLETALLQSGKNVSRYSYPGTTTLWKRRWMFIFSLFSFWRGYQIYTLLVEEKPQVIWLHSVMRYIGFWGILAISLYTRKYPSRILFSHHDLGSLAPFVQSVTEESDIPTTFRIRDFIEHTSGIRKVIACFKWVYVFLCRQVLPRPITHVLFASFLESHIRHHFPGDSILLFPHSYDESIFHP